MTMDTPRNIPMLTRSALVSEASRPFPVEIRETPSKGRGLFATRKISRGERILAEEPLLVYPVESSSRSDGLMARLQDLSLERRERFLGLYHDLREPGSGPNCLEVSTAQVADRIVELNGFALERRDDITEGGVFDVASSMNHSCAPNVHCSASPGDGRVQVVHATRDIMAGEELECSYIAGSFLTRQERQDLLDRWGFKCRCKACDMDGDDAALRMKRSDNNRRMALGLEERLAKVRRMLETKADVCQTDLRAAAEMCVALQHVMQVEQTSLAQIADMCVALLVPRPRPDTRRCLGACLCFVSVGNSAAANDWRYRARDLVMTCYGTDSYLYRNFFDSGKSDSEDIVA